MVWSLIWARTSHQSSFFGSGLVSGLASGLPLDVRSLDFRSVDLGSVDLRSSGAGASSADSDPELEMEAATTNSGWRAIMSRGVSLFNCRTRGESRPGSICRLLRTLV